MSAEPLKLILTPEQEKRFWDKVDVRGPDDCWNWKASTFWNGYGRVRFGNKDRGAHRMCYEFHHRILSRWEFVCHKCDNPLCVNPKHFFLGDPQANMDDKVRKGRHRCGLGDRNGARTHPEKVARGERQGHAKLTAELVREIRERYPIAGLSQAALGKEYGVSQGVISAIWRGTMWRHLWAS